MVVLSVHLATRSWAELGVALLRLQTDPEGNPDRDWERGSGRDRGRDWGGMPGKTRVGCEILPWQEAEAPPVVELAERLDAACRRYGATVLMLDGPQAWMADDTGHRHSRTAERALHTAAKMGPPGTVLPGSYERFVGYCLALYDALARLGWRRLVAGQTAEPNGVRERFLVESYPHAAWKSLGVRPLPARRRCRVSDLARAWEALTAVVPIDVNRPPNHAQMQAIVGGLPGLALAADWDTRQARPPVESRVVGEPPRQQGGHWREGYIAVPVRPGGGDTIRFRR